MRFTFTALLLTGALLAGTAQAQYTGALGSTWNNPVSASISQMILNGINRKALETQLQKTSTSRPQTIRYQYPLSRTDFTFKGKPSGQQNCAALADTPADQKQLAELCLNIYQQIEAQANFRKHNLAAGLTLLLGASWQVGQGQEFTDGMFESMQRTLNDQLVSGGAMQKLGAQDIQSLYESAVMTGGFILALQGDDKPASHDLAQALAAAVLKSFGLNN